MSIETTKEILSKSESAVYDYIQERTKNGEVSLKESMKAIGLNLGLSEATVHRAISKMVDRGVVSITPSSDKSESNGIIFFGEPNNPQELKNDRFFDMILEIQQRAERFKNIIENYRVQLEAVNQENRQLKEKLELAGAGELSSLCEELSEENKRLKNAASESKKKMRDLKVENSKLKDELEAAADNRFITYGDYTISESDIVGTTDISEELIAFIMKK